MKHSSPPPIYCYFSLDHLEARLRQDQGWTPQLGTTSADVVRSGVVMVEFLNALLGDPRVHECFQRLYERVFDGSIDNYLDHARHYQDITLKDLQQFVEDTLDFPRPQVFPSSLAMHLDSAFWSHAYSLHSGEPEPRAISYTLAYSLPRAPEVALSFKTVPGEGKVGARRTAKLCFPTPPSE